MDFLNRDRIKSKRNGILDHEFPWIIILEGFTSSSTPTCAYLQAEKPPRHKIFPKIKDDDN